MHIAYLTNQYPAPSHTFIRREINALERLDVAVTRFSIRPAKDTGGDPEDEREAKLTSAILGATMTELLSSAVSSVIGDPGAAIRTAASAWRMTRGGQRRLIRTAACWVEACWLSRRLTSAKVHHLHAHFGTNSAAVARLAARMAHIPYSITIHGPEEFDNVEALDLGGKVEDAAFTVAVSSFGRSQICRFVPTAVWPRINVVRCGLDLAAWEASSRGESDAVDLCFVGRLAPQKGIPMLLEAIAALHARGIVVRTMIIGSGALLAELQRYCEQAGIASTVKFAGAKYGADVAAAMRNAKIVVVPSFAEGLPVVIMEAFAAGVPVISTYIAGIPELVDEHCGALVAAGDAVALARAIEQMLQAGAEQRQAMGLTGRKRVAEHHDIDRNAHQLKHLFGQYSGAVQ